MREFLRFIQTISCGCRRLAVLLRIITRGHIWLWDQMLYIRISEYHNNTFTLFGPHPYQEQLTFIIFHVHWSLWSGLVEYWTWWTLSAMQEYTLDGMLVNHRAPYTNSYTLYFLILIRISTSFHKVVAILLKSHTNPFKSNNNTHSHLGAI